MVSFSNRSDSPRRFPDPGSLRKLGLAAGLMGAVILFWFNPEVSRFFPPCPLHTFTGLFCAGCGSTRALHQLLHGNVAAAFRFNPLLVLSLPVLGWFYFRPGVVYRAAVAWASFAILVLYGVCRNIPVWPLTLLVPG